jgi:ParB-like chromosome segregation protein Spo0J
MTKRKIIIRSAKERHVALISVDEIVVVNSRERDEKRFEETVRSIEVVGLQKPICVNERNLEKTGKYELVCGEGRLRAFRQARQQDHTQRRSVVRSIDGFLPAVECGAQYRMR